MAAISNAEPMPRDEIPDMGPKRQGPGKEGALIADLLKLLLKIRARELNVASRLIARGDDLDAIASGVRENLAVLRGWRNEIFGQDALDLVDGKLAFAVVDGKLVMTRAEVLETSA
jgi:ribonuclease D